MKSVETVRTEAEGWEPNRLLYDTRGQPNSLGTFQRHWREFKPCKEAEEQVDVDARPEPNRGTLATRIDAKRDAALDRLPLPIPPSTRQFVSFRPMQEWEGTVTKVGRDTFTARLTDLTANRNIAEEEADFLIEDVAEDDRALLHPGAIFRWAVGYQRASGGSKKRVSHIVFRRLPLLTKKDVAEAEVEGKWRSIALQWE